MHTHASTIYTDHGTFNLETSEISVNASESVGNPCLFFYHVCHVFVSMYVHVFVSMYMHMCEGGLGNQKGVMGLLEEQEFLPVRHLFFNLSVFFPPIPFYV